MSTVADSDEGSLLLRQGALPPLALTVDASSLAQAADDPPLALTVDAPPLAQAADAPPLGTGYRRTLPGHLSALVTDGSLRPPSHWPSARRWPRPLPGAPSAASPEMRGRKSSSAKRDDRLRILPSVAT